MNNKEVLGILTEEIARKFQLDKHKGKKIVIYEDRKKYIEKHKDEYSSIDSFNKTVNNLSTIITTPDYVFYNE